MHKQRNERSYSARLQLRRLLVEDAAQDAADRIVEAGFWAPPFARAGNVIAFPKAVSAPACPPAPIPQRT